MRETCHLKYDASLASPVPFFRSSPSALSLRNLIPTSCHATVAVPSLCQDVARRGGQLGEFPRESRANCAVTPPLPPFSFSRDDVVVIVSVASQYVPPLSLSLSFPYFFVFRKLPSFHFRRERARNPFLFFFFFFFFFDTDTDVLPW